MTTTPEELEQQLTDLLVGPTPSSGEGDAGEEEPRAGLPSLHAIAGKLREWCECAAEHAFVVEAQSGGAAQRALSEWGRNILGVLLARLAGPGSAAGLPPALCEWLRTAILPVLFSGTGSTTAAVEAELARSLLELLLNSLANQAGAAAAVVGADPGEPGKGGRKRAKADALPKAPKKKK